MQDSSQLSVENIEDEKFQDDIVISNQIHKDGDNLGHISNQCIVPVAQVYGITRPDVNTDLNVSKLNYDYYEHAIDFDKRDPPFINKTINTRQFDCSLIDELDEIKSFEDVINTDPKELFLIEASDNYPTQKDTYYICSVEYKLIFDFSTESDMYDKRLQYSKSKYPQSSFKSDLNNISNVKYKLDDKSLKIREDKDGVFGIDPDILENYTSKIGMGIFCGMGIFSFLGIVAYINIFASLISIMFVSLFILAGFMMLHEEYGSFWMTVSKTYDNEEKLQIPYDEIKNIRESISSNENNNLDIINVKINDGKLVCEDRSTTWDIYNDKYDIYEKRATEFFVDMGFNSIQKSFSAYIASLDADINTDKTTLESDCGKYLLIPKNTTLRE